MCWDGFKYPQICLPWFAVAMWMFFLFQITSKWNAHAQLSDKQSEFCSVLRDKFFPGEPSAQDYESVSFQVDTQSFSWNWMGILWFGLVIILTNLKVVKSVKNQLQNATHCYFSWRGCFLVSRAPTIFHSFWIWFRSVIKSRKTCLSRGSESDGRVMWFGFLSCLLQWKLQVSCQPYKALATISPV